MFSRVFVCPQRWGGVGISGTRFLPVGRVGYSRGMGRVCPEWVGGCRGWVPTPLLLTPSDGHHMYCRQAGGTHSTGMLSCYALFTRNVCVCFNVKVTVKIYHCINGDANPNVENGFWPIHDIWWIFLTRVLFDMTWHITEKHVAAYKHSLTQIEKLMKTNLSPEVSIRMWLSSMLFHFCMYGKC